MAIDITTERVITFGQATKYVPRRRAGKKPATSTIYRWANTGIGGVKLEVIRIGGGLCTSIEALQRFFDLLTESHANTVNDLEQRRPTKADDVITKQLDDLGI